MDYRTLHAKTVAELRQLARAEGVKIPAGTNKALMVELIVEAQAGRAKATAQPVADATAEAKPAQLTAVVVATAKPAEVAAKAKPAKLAVKAAVEAKSIQSAAAEEAAAATSAPKRRGRPKKSAQVTTENVPAPPVKVEKKARTAAPVKAVVAEQTAAVTLAKADSTAAGSGAEAAKSVISRPEAPRQPAPAAVQPASQNAVPADMPQNAQESAQPPAQFQATNAQQPSAPLQRAYHRPLSTQQRMGARTQPVAPSYRTPQRAAGQSLQRPVSRFNVETQQGRPLRSQEGMQNGFRRRPQEPRLMEPSHPVEPQRPAEQPQRPVQPQAAASRMPETQPEAQAQPWRRAALSSETQPQVEERQALNPALPELLQNGDCGDGAGILEIHPDGYGFLRAENYLPGNRDVYVSAAQIRRFNLRTGDYVVGKTRAQLAGDRSVGLIYINEVNGQTPDMARSRRFFDSLTPVYPNERLRMECSGQNDLSLRLIDMIAPIGKGQRGMIVSQPKAGKTTLLKKIANAITTNNPDVHLIVLLIDERPEEVTDMKRSIQGEVVYSTFDEAPENHTRVSEMVLERAQRLVELGKDVVILLDSITRLARAYNLVIPPTGRSLSGGLDPGALLRPKRFFGAARNIENGGSLTIIATALVDTGSRMDDIIFEEFKGTGNMELHLDRSLSDRRIFPAIDLYKSGTRREELLLTREELEGAYQVRRMLSKGSPQETAEQLISLVEKTKTNEEFFQKLKGWMNVCEKDGFK